MKGTLEIKNKISRLRNEMKSYAAEGDTDNALKIKNDIELLMKDYKIAELQETALGSIQNNAAPKGKAIPDTIKVMNKLLRGQKLTKYENALVEQTGDVSGGEYLVPLEQIREIIQFKDTLISLKNKCEVIPVRTNKGTIPVEINENETLVETEELGNINPSDIQFGQLDYGINEYNALIFISNNFLADTIYNVSSIINKKFARRAVRTENKYILGILDQCTTTTGDDYKALIYAKTNNLDPANARVAEIITDQDGYNYLDTLTDKNGRPLLIDSLSKPGFKEFKGMPVTYLKNGDITRPSGQLQFYVGNVEQAVAFLDRKHYTINVSTQVAFIQRAKAYLVTERFDTQLKDPNAVIVVNIPDTFLETNNISTTVKTNNNIKLNSTKSASTTKSTSASTK